MADNNIQRAKGLQEQFIQVLLDEAMNSSGKLINQLKAEIDKAQEQRIFSLERQIAALEIKLLGIRKSVVARGNGTTKKFSIPVTDPKSFSIEFLSATVWKTAFVEGGHDKSGLLESVKPTGPNSVEIVFKTLPEEDSELRIIHQDHTIYDDVRELKQAQACNTTEEKISKLRSDFDRLDQKIMSAGRVLSGEKIPGE